MTENGIRDNRILGLSIGFHKGEAYIQWENVRFNEDSTEWQYASGEIIVKDDYDKVAVFVMFYENENKAYFDGIQM